MAIKHAKTAGNPETPRLNDTDWNDDHTIDDGTLSIAKTSGLQAALDAKADASALGSYIPYSGATADVNLGANSLAAQDVTLPSSATVTPSAPAANYVTLFGRNVAGKALPAFIGNSGFDTSLQPLLSRNKIAMATAAGNGSTITYIGTLSNSATGTASSFSVATTNNYTAFKRVEYLVTVAATNAVAGWRSAGLQYWNEKGYLMMCQWGAATGVTGVSTKRAFVGMRGSTSAPTDVDPSSLTNIIGMGWDSGDTNIQIFHNDGSGTATKIDLGSGFPVPTTDRQTTYEIALFAKPNGDVNYEIREVNTSNVATGTITTDKPAQTQLMTILGYSSVGGTSSVTGISMVQYYLETDY